ncbi:hypothetical protein CEP53_015321, partial [Fusarium sp. AF-6]
RREHFLRYFNIAEPDLKGHHTESSFYQKWTKERQKASRAGSDMPSSSPPSTYSAPRLPNQARTPLTDDERVEFAKKYEVVAKHLNFEFDRTNDVRHLAESVDSLWRAFHLLPKGARKQQIMIKDNICTKLGRMAEVTRSSAAISEALLINEECREAAEHLQDQDQPMVFAGTLLHAGILLKMRALANRTYPDLDQAILHFERALQGLEVQSGQKATDMKVALVEEMTACHTRRSWTLGGCKVHAEKAVRLCVTARSTLRGYTSTTQATLSEALLARYHATGSQDDLYRAFIHGTKAILHADKNNFKYAEHLTLMADIYIHGYESHAWQPNLQFIRARRRIVQPGTGIITARLRRRCCHVLRVTSVKMVGPAIPTCRQQDLNTAMLLLRAAATSPAVPMTRFLASARLGLCLSYLQKWPQASVAFDKALALLPEVAPSVLPLQDSLSSLRNLYDMSSLAAGAKLRVGKSAGEALVALESGRCYSYGLTLDSRPVQAASPDLTNQRNSIQDIINVFRNQDPKAPVMPSIVEIVKEMGTLRLIDAKIRRHPGLQNFLQPPTEADLISLASEGPIVCFIANQAGSYFIAVTKDGIKMRELGGLDESKLRNDVRLVTRPSPGVEETARKLTARTQDLSRILTDLWRVAVRPVMDELGLLSKSAVGSTSRIWWITSGLTGLLPIHAAGQFGGTAGERAGDFVVSSYTPSLRLLQESRRNRTVLPEKDQCRVLMVAMPETAGKDKLEVAGDIEFVRQILKSAGWPEPVVLVRPSKAQVVGALQKCHIAIFACHGVADPHDPSRSGLLLRADERGVPEILNIADLQDLGLRHARLACLLACDSGNNAARWLWDECIHVAGSFQLAGFSEVVATLCEVQDRSTSKVTKAFLREIVQRRGDVSFAGAFHSALKGIKRLSEDDHLGEWSSFVHLGA